MGSNHITEAPDLESPELESGPLGRSFEPKETKVYCGKDTSCKKLKDAMRKGVKIARRLIRNHTQMDSFQCRDSDSSDDESSDEGSDSDEVDDCGFDSGFYIQIDSLDSSDFISKEGNIYHLSSAKEKFLNDGKSRMSGQSRKKMITGVEISKMSMRPACPVDERVARQ
jgi:hypothetical protein